MENNNIKNFKKLVSNDVSKWMQEFKWRKENKLWLDQSFKISVKILREIRRQNPINGMNQQKLAEKMGVSTQNINNLLRGKEKFSLQTIVNIENILGINLQNIKK